MQEVEIWALIPFVIMLLGIAVFPFIIGKWWEKNTNKLIFSLVLGIPTAIYLITKGLGAEIADQMLYDYIPFIVLLCSLFVVTGGLYRGGDIEAKPWVNTTILAIGFVLASLIGTTGAAMLLIRMLLEINKQRKHKIHTVLFFTAVVANCGGLLSPLGDPPLFLLYLRGADFSWFMNMFPEWLFVGAVLLTIYYFTDRYYYKREPHECIEADKAESTGLKIKGAINGIYLLIIIWAVAFVNADRIPAMGAEDAPIYMKYLREIILIAVILLSWFTTKKSVREANHYSWSPIIEVAVLFIGIFATMTPAMIYLNANASSLGLTAPWQFFYSTGAVSSFLDNAPTAVAFYTIASGLPVVEGIPYVAGIPEVLLRAIALGSVFFGSMTYIGNGPNFMIKSIAEENGIAMPSFFGYIFKFSLIVLLPTYIVMQFIFL